MLTRQWQCEAAPDRAVCLFFLPAPLTNQDPSVYSCAAVSVLTSTGALISAAKESFCEGYTLLFKTSGPGEEDPEPQPQVWGSKERGMLALGWPWND